MSTKISVILPIFNVEQYLRQCIDSIGLLGHDEVEIILVNDGSTDGSREICREYALKWDNVRLIDKTNGGLSDARNWGTEAAQGDFIYYLDSDDWLVPGAIMRLYEFALENSCDVVQGGFYYAFDDYLEYDDRWITEKTKPFVLNQEEAMRELLKNNYIKNFAWGKIYKSSIVKSHKFPFGKFYEDSYWQHHIISEVRRYGVMPQPLYFYRQRSSSISGSRSGRIIDLLRGNELRLAFVSEKFPHMTSIAADSLWRSSFALRNSGREFSKFFERINNDYSSLLSNELKSSLLYKLVRKKSSYLAKYLFARKVITHFKSKRLKRIAYSK